MNATTYIKNQLEATRSWALALLTDMQDAPLTQPTPNGGNHPLWVLGHMIHSESHLFDSLIHGRPNRFPEWEGLFSMGSVPTTDAENYPSMEELLTKFETMRAASLAHLEQLTDDDLDQPSHAPEEFKQFFGTVGSCYSAMCTHVSFHTGQAADARLAAGRLPLMA